MTEEHRSDYHEFKAKGQREFEIKLQRKIEEGMTLSKKLQRDCEEIDTKRIKEMDEFGEETKKSNRSKERENERMEKEIDQLKKEKRNWKRM